MTTDIHKIVYVICHNNKCHCFTVNCACQFPPARQFFNSGHVTVSSLPSTCCCAYSFNVCKLIHKPQTVPFGQLEPERNSWITTSIEKLTGSTGYRRKCACSVLVLSFLKTYHDIFGGVLRCFGIFQIVSDIVFKADILSTDDFIKPQVSCASPTLSVATDIGYEYWKRSALRNMTSLACETKPTICKLSKSRYSPI